MADAVHRCPGCGEDACAHVDGPPRSYECLACEGAWPIGLDGVQRCMGCAELLIAAEGVAQPGTAARSRWHTSCLGLKMEGNSTRKVARAN